MIRFLSFLKLFSLRPRGPAVCEACGGPFTCGAKLTSCWCSEIQLSDDTQAELKQRYRNCLCRQCLEAFAANENSCSLVDNIS